MFVDVGVRAVVILVANAVLFELEAFRLLICGNDNSSYPELTANSDSKWKFIRKGYTKPCPRVNAGFLPRKECWEMSRLSIPSRVLKD